MTIRLKLFLYSALIGLLPLLALGWYSISTTEKNIQKNTFTELSSINRLSQSVLNEWTNDALHQLESLAQHSFVRDSIVKLIKGEGDRTLQQNLVNEHFNPHLRLQNNLNLLAVIDLSKKIILSTDASLEDQIFDQDRYFIEGQLYSFVGNVGYSAGTRQAVLHAFTPVRNNEGVTVAVLFAQINWSRASQFFSYAMADRTALESYQVDRNHFLLSSSKSIAAVPRKKIVSSSGIQACFNTGSGQGTYTNYQGIKVLGVYQWFPDLEICLLTESAESALAELINNLKIKYYGASLLLASLDILFALFIASSLSRPIRGLVAGAANLGQGHLDYRFSETGGELGVVQKALNEMAASLAIVLSSRDELNNEVEQRKQVELNLNRAMSDLKKSNQDLEQFAYVASHDLQEPLRTITSYLQLLERRYREHLDSDALEFIDYIVEAASRMKNQINDLLDYSRVGRKDVSFVDIDLNQIVNKVIQQNHIYIQENGATLQVGNLPTVKGVSAQFTQLFQNLINNAIKFHRKGTPPLIRINAERTEDHWTITVADNGIGIEPEYLEKIFVIFQRLHSMVDYPGTGIGLALCKRIVENHDGSISVTSTPGVGTTFNIKLNTEKIEPL